MHDLVPRLRAIMAELHAGMAALIDAKDYSEAARALRVADKLLLDLIGDSGGHVVPKI